MSLDPAGGSSDLARTDVTAWLDRRLDALRGAVDRPLVTAVAAVVALSLAAKVAAVAKDLLVAYRFGVSLELDAFIVASLGPTTILYAFGASASDAFLPVFVRARAAGHAAAERSFGATMTLGLGSLGAAAAVAALGAPALIAIVGPGFGPEASALATVLLLLMLPVLVLGGWSCAWPAVLNVSGLQALTAATPLITPLATIAWIVAADRLGVLGLAAGAVTGAVLETAVLAVAVRRSGFSVLPSWTERSAAVSEFAGQLGPLLGAAALATSAAVIDQAMATATGAGAVAALTYANRVVLLVSGLAGLVLTLIVLPRFATDVARGADAAFRRDAAAYVALAAAGGLVLAAAVAAWSGPITALLFERGAFGPADTALVAGIQTLLAFQLPFLLPGLVAIRALVALSRARSIFAVASLSLGLHYVGNVILIPVLGVHGIALSTTIASAAVCLVLLAVVRRAAPRRAP